MSDADGWARAHELDAEVRRAWEHAHKLNDDLQAHVAVMAATTHYADSLAVWNKATPFLDDPRFMTAYRRGMNSGHRISRKEGSAADLHIEWRVHTLCWAAAHASKLTGDFVECGVNTGIYSLAICHYLDFNSLDRDFWLFDTFNGIPASQMTDGERAVIRPDVANYFECYELARSNFAPYRRAHLVRGTVPETLDTVTIERVAYLSIDMNITAPEVAALEHFWPRLVSGGVVVLDDYGWLAHTAQRVALDAVAQRVGVSILTLPTGQGLLLKP